MAFTPVDRGSYPPAPSTSRAAAACGVYTALWPAPTSGGSNVFLGPDENGAWGRSGRRNGNRTRDWLRNIGT